jgi:hypothetical protein
MVNQKGRTLEVIALGGTVVVQPQKVARRVQSIVASIVSSCRREASNMPGCP